MTTNKKDYSINKPNFAIYTQSNLNNTQRKLFNHFIYEFGLNDFKGDRIEFDKSDISHILDTRRSRTGIINIFAGLQTNLLIPVNIDIDMFKNFYKSVQYIGSVSINRSHCIVSMDFMLRNYLDINYTNSKGYQPNLNLGYTKLELNIINKLKKVHSIPLYEIMKKHAYQKKAVLGFDFMMNFFAKDKSDIQDFKRFNARILKPAIEEINTLTDLNITYNLIKKSNKASEIEFNIKQLTQKAINQ